MRAPQIIAAIALASALSCLAVPAHAADEVGVSPDGVTWHDHLTEPLFAEPELWVPGDIETRSFWVRNQTGDPGALLVSLLHDDTHELVANDHIEIEARADGGAWIAIESGAAEADLIERSLAAGDAVQIDVRVTAPWQSPNASQTDVLPLDLVVSLTQAGTTAGGASGEEPDAGGSSREGLAVTGATVAHGVLWTAALLVGGGLALAARRREPRAGDDHGAV